VCRRNRRQVPAPPRRAPVLPSQATERCSIDSMPDTLADRRALRTQNAVDELTREALAIEVGRSIRGARVPGLSVLNLHPLPLTR
jgi:hypothetical protein